MSATPHALVTIAAPLAPTRIDDVRTAIALLGNPAAPAIATALTALDESGDGTHFVSLHAVMLPDGSGGTVLLEMSADGTPERAIARLVDAIGEPLRCIFALARDWSDGGNLADYLAKHRLACGSGLLDLPGLAFAGTPGLSVGRIRAEGRLSDRLSALIEEQHGAPSALALLATLRAAIAAEPDLAPMLQPAAAEDPFVATTKLGLVPKLIGAFVTRYLWPVWLVVALVALGWAAWTAWHGPPPHPALARGAAAFLMAVSAGLLIAAVAVVVGVVIAYLALRRAEARDAVDGRPADHAINAAMFAAESGSGQNHMISIAERKPGLLRALTLRLVFWVIGAASGTIYRPGFLGSIGSIHFARWVTLPNSRALVFLSNYDGSWQSYLEDFITRAHGGLTGVWSNTIGFPRAENLVGKGATDGERFKRFARRSMIPTGFWYSAYPQLTTSAIRTNAQVRRGLSGAMTEDEAVAWLAMFGSAPRPAGKLVSSEIQSLAFGGLGFMPAGVCLVAPLPDTVAGARAWLRAVAPHIAFNDGRRLKARAVVTLTLGASGLRKLGLPDDALATFSYPFLAGMTGEGRGGILGDVGANAPEQWQWGAKPPDAALLLYGLDEDAVTALRDELETAFARTGAVAPYCIPLQPVSHKKREPFGFADGISQPVIRGTYKGFRNADPIHLVEPGEFILGYPDERGDVPPVPTLSATDDPTNRLPIAARLEGFDRAVVESPRDLGFNGSYLVIRQLEQHVATFNAYCQDEAARLLDDDRLPQPYVVTPEFIGAKLIGRWPDGSSLARFPYEPRERAGLREGPTARPTPVTTGDAPAVDRPIEPTTAPDNDFLLGTEDPEALRCPFGAHIRRANPRDSLVPGSADQISISNRHRIMRVGRVYRETDGDDPGLLFMCLNADIERQFEFLQQTWLLSPFFHGLTNEKDPVMGDAEDGRCSFTMPTRRGPIRLKPLPRFVTVRGGGYFFMPGKRLIDWLLQAP